MPIAVNKNTTQTPLSDLGRTGVQSTKWIPAPRVYVTAAQSISDTTIPTTPSMGTTPDSWKDLGIVDGLARITLDRKVTPVVTGLDGKLRMAVTESMSASIQFSLSQLDDLAVETITALTPTLITDHSVPAKTVGATYLLGQKPLNQLAVLLVCQNKFDGKEWQYYNPNAYLNFDFTADSLQVTGLLPWFRAAGQSRQCAYSATIFTANATGGVVNSVGYGLGPYGLVGFGL